jgi:cellulose biosynthesis protein BcsS
VVRTWLVKPRVGLLPRFLGRLLASACIVPAVALAQDLPPPETPQTPAPSIIQHAAVDGSAVVTSLGDRSLDLNGTFSPYGDINDSGFRLRLSASASWYRFITNQTPLTYGSGHTLEGGFLAGYQWSMPRVSFIGLIGPTLAESTDQGVNTTHLGAKMVLSAYARPSDQTMAWGSLSYSTIANFLQLQAKTGVKLWGDVYVGPEAAFFWRNVVPSYDNVAVMRLGAHVSAVAFGPVLAGVAAGVAHQQQLGWGYYGSVNFYWTF